MNAGSPGRLGALRSRWAALAPREQLALRVAAAVLGALLLWSLALAPAWRTVRDAPAQLDQLDAQLQQLQRLAAESRELAGMAPVAPAQSRAALEAATARLGTGARLAVQGDRATLSITAADPEALAAWLGEARSAARARPVEAQLTRGAQGYGGSLVVQLGAAP